MISEEPTPVSSSNLSNVWYKGGALYIEFRSGGIYKADGVSEIEADDLLQASSPGGYFHQFLKDSYAWERVG
jgi:hypothetical protein